MILNVAFVVAIAVATSASTTGITHDKNGLMSKILALQQNEFIKFKESVQKNTTTTTTEIKRIYRMIKSLHPMNSTQAPPVHVEKDSTDAVEEEPQPLLVAILGGIVLLTLFLLICHLGWCDEMDGLYGRNAPETTSSTPRVVISVTESSTMETPPLTPPPPYRLLAISPETHEVILVPVHSAPSEQ